MAMEYYEFITALPQSGKAAAVANALALPAKTILIIVGLVVCAAGIYAVCSLARWISVWAIRLFQERLPEKRKANIIANLKRNWYFPISAIAFFCLSGTLKGEYFIGLLFAFAASLVMASQIRSLVSFAKQNRTFLKVISIMTAVGICWGVQSYFYAHWSDPPNGEMLKAMLPTSIDLPFAVSVVGAAAAVFFVYICVLIFWKELIKIFCAGNMFSGINVTEAIVYGILIIASLAGMAVAFAKTEAFYGTEYLCDIIYTGDSPSLVKDNVYVVLTHPENDLRQPLFAVFAAPFAGIPYLFGKLLRVPASVQAILVNMIQVFMMFSANFMLTKIMKLNCTKRICFMLLTSCTYTHLLFTLMMEQYIVAYFWLILCVYQISEKRHPDRMVLWGAGGTLLTSMILLPLMSDKEPIKNFKEWIADMMRYGLEFAAVMLVFCRFDVLSGSMSYITVLSEFTGKTVTLADKIYQYTAFVSNCFAAPDAGVNNTAVDYISWQLNPVITVNFLGIALLLLVIISFILNKDEKICLIAAGWVVFSVIMLLILGWGTKENGLILYSLYFGWAFCVLLFRLVEKIEDKLKVKFLVPVLSVGCAVVLAVINIPAIKEMVDFAITCYPA